MKSKNIKKSDDVSIEDIDNRIDKINKKISSLMTEKETLISKRRNLFEKSDNSCELKYEFIEEDAELYSRKCRFYIEIDGHKEIFVECSVYFDESPSKVWLMKIPEKYKNDFLMLWEKAHRKDIEYYSKKSQEDYEKIEKQFCTNKDFYKKCYRLLAKSIHPDNSDGNIEAMQCLNQLKVMWGI